ALSLVVPAAAVVTDRTAAWFHGVAIQPRTARAELPPISLFRTSGTRVRRARVAGGTRALLDRDIAVVSGVRVTTPERTALDLGRLLWRFDALAALDGFLRIGVEKERLLADTDRFRGFRGVVQLRQLLPLANGQAESPGESALRLHWYDAGLPTPELQWWIRDYDGRPAYRLDLALPELKYCGEYDGQRFHSDPEQRAGDRVRRDWLVGEGGWTVDVFDKSSVYGLNPDAGHRLAESYHRIRHGG
ncbi:MAG: type IV toxin-antitoxin system AbiEi family antitoxin, partial [Nocardioides sp.]